MKTRTKSFLVTTACVSALSAAASVHAQSDDEIIVTATRRAENIQDVPIAVTAIQPDQLAKQGIVNIQNLGALAPSFATSQAQTSSGTVVLRVRGIGTTSNNIGFESAVGVFIDGAYQSRPGVALGEFVDVERVEVLRGPQGTLFGRNTSAGALNITNKRPDLEEFGGFVNATYGNFDHQSVQGAVNFPIVDGKAALRLTGAFRERDGYIDIRNKDDVEIGESNSIDQTMLRAQFGFEADNGFEGRLILDYAESDAVCCAAVEVLQSPVETGGVFDRVGLGPRGGMIGREVAVDATDTAAAQRAVDNLIASSDQEPDPSNDQFGFTAELEYPLSDNIDLIYIGSYRDYEAEEEYDSDFSGLDVFNVLDGSDTTIETITHELRAQGDAFDGRLSWLVGGYYSEEDIFQITNFGLGEDYGELIGALLFPSTSGAFGANPLTVVSGGVDPSVVRTSNAYTQDSTSFSIFTHNIFDITDNFNVTAGLRYSDENKDGSFFQPSVNNPLCAGLLANLDLTQLPNLVFPPAPGALGPTLLGTGCFAFTAQADLPQAAFLPLPRTFDEEFEDDELIYTLKAAYQFDNGTNIYAGFTHGYKSGGFNLDSTAAAGGADPRFRSELVDAWEVGLKSRLVDDRLTLNIAAFFEEFEDFQVLEFTGAQFQTFNVPKAETSGVEIESSFEVTDNFTLNASLTALEAEYPGDCAGSQTDVARIVALCGNSLTNAPEEVGLIGATYEGSLGGNLKFFLNGQARYESDRRTSTQAIIVPNAAAITAAGSLEAAVAAAERTPFDIQPSNTKVNLRAGITDKDEIWAIEVWGTNVTNEITRGVTFNTVLRSGSRSAFIQEPRTYGVTLRRNF